MVCNLVLLIHGFYIITEPPQVVEPPNVDHEPPHTDEIEAVEEKLDDQVPDEIPASDDREIVVEAEPTINENHISTVVESVTSSSPEEAPKKSYASIVSSQTKKGPTKIYVPANTAKVTPAKIEKPSVNSAKETSASEASVPSEPINAPESKDLPDEGTSLLLPMNQFIRMYKHDDIPSVFFNLREIVSMQIIHLLVMNLIIYVLLLQLRVTPYTSAICL